MRLIIQNLDDDDTNVISELQMDGINVVEFPKELFWLDYDNWIQSNFVDNSEKYFFVGSIKKT